MQMLLKKLGTIGAIFILSSIFGMPVQAQENSLRAPEVLDLDDPFARGINRAADQATDGLTLPAPDGIAKEEVKTGAALLGSSDREALPVNLYRVAALAVAQGSARGQIFEESNQDVSEGSRPELAYLRLGTFGDSAEARQTAINLKAVMEDYIGGHFILRRAPSSVDLDIGPLHSVTHAENYCEIMLKLSNGLVQDCYAVLEYPGYEPLDTFKSTAMLRMSPDAVRRVLQDDNVFDLQNSSRQLFRVSEGEMLGTSGHQVVKIIPSDVILVSDDGTITALPLNYLPEPEFGGSDTQTATTAPATNANQLPQ